MIVDRCATRLVVFWKQQRINTVYTIYNNNHKYSGEIFSLYSRILVYLCSGASRLHCDEKKKGKTRGYNIYHGIHRRESKYPSSPPPHPVFHCCCVQCSRKIIEPRSDLSANSSFSIYRYITHCFNFGVFPIGP